MRTRTKLRAAENDANLHVLATDIVNDNANLPLDARNDTPALMDKGTAYPSQTYYIKEIQRT